MAEFKIPTETVTLPSKGAFYSENNPLSKGTVEIKYMTAKEEDILTNQSYIENGTVIDKLLKAVVVTKFDWDELLIGDKNAIMIAARILGYGKDYSFSYGRNKEVVDLSLLKDKIVDEKVFKTGKNEFAFTLPHSGNALTYKLITHGDERKISSELKGLKRIDKDSSPEGTTRLKYLITSIEGKTEKKDIREFVDKYLLARDARALREEIIKNTPDLDLTFFPRGRETSVALPIGLEFFWPDSEIGS